MSPKIAVAVTTRNRHERVRTCVEELQANCPPGTPILVVDDASDTPPPVEVAARFTENVGIARAKNKCLELLMETDADHFFLFDDDTYPTDPDWWRLYVENPEPHLMYLFRDPWDLTKPPLIYADEETYAFSHPRGCMLYLERRVVERVGGMRPEFGRWGWEHVEYSSRIHNAGFTTCRYMDALGSDKVIYAADQVEASEVIRSVPDSDRQALVGLNESIFRLYRHSDDYVEYRSQRDVVVTHLLTAFPDPQRGHRLPDDPNLLKDLHDSLPPGIRLVVLHTGLDETSAASVLPQAEFHRVRQVINPYFSRWVHTFQWLREHPEVGRVWCVDGTDVKMLRNPFPHMASGTLYTGYEPTTLADPWLVNNHPDTMLQKFFAANSQKMLLNAGLLGGPRQMVMDFAQDIVRIFFDDHVDRLTGEEPHLVYNQHVGDMGVFNYVAYSLFDVVTGPQVCTVFKAEQQVSDVSWWKHK